MDHHSASDFRNPEDKLHVSGAETTKFHERILDATHLAIVSMSTGGVITSFNRAAEHLLGYAATELLGRYTPLIFFDEKTLKRLAADQLIKNELEFTIQPVELNKRLGADRRRVSLIRKDGTRCPALMSITGIPDERGAVAGYAITFLDESEQEMIRDQVNASEKKFRLLAENIPGAIYLCHNDDAYSVIYLNDYIERITGYSAHDFIVGKITFSALFHPDDNDMIHESINRAVAAKQSFHLRYRLRHASGEWKWVDEVGVGVFEHDTLIMLEGFISDITDQKKAEEQLHQNAADNLRFFDNPVNLNIIADFEGNLKRISPSWMRLLGWSDKELRARPFIEFIHPDDTKLTADIFASVIREQRIFTFENRVLAKDGSYRWLLWGSASDQRSQRIYASAIDITHRKTSEEQILDSKSSLEALARQLQEQNRQLDEFAHIISHNLRAPLNNIQALVNLVDDNSAIADYKLIFDKLKNVSKNLGETMNELMDTLKVKSAPAATLSELRLKELLDKVVQSLEGELIVAQASVTFDFNQAPTLHYSKPYLESIFQNLLTNAIKYRSPHRRPMIHFQSAKDGDWLELRVSDNGQGIDLNLYSDKLFGLHKTFHDHQEARGVGLFLIKTQIESLGGSISVESEVDKGTTFIIRFLN